MFSKILPPKYEYMLVGLQQSKVHPFFPKICKFLIFDILIQNLVKFKTVSTSAHVSPSLYTNQVDHRPPLQPPVSAECQRQCPSSECHTQWTYPDCPQQPAHSGWLHCPVNDGWKGGYFVKRRVLNGKADTLWKVEYFVNRRVLCEQAGALWKGGYFVNRRVLCKRWLGTLW